MMDDWGIQLAIGLLGRVGKLNLRKVERDLVHGHNV